MTLRTSWMPILLAGLLLAGCSSESQKDTAQPTADTKADSDSGAAAHAEPKPSTDANEGGAGGVAALSGPTILLSQAQFIRPEGGGVKPGPARLVILQPDGDEWTRTVLEDPDSNVFHKAIVWTDPTHPDAGRGILTIAAEAASIKFWTPQTDGWTARTLWTGEFGGKWDRLRDFEIGDLTGDGQDDIGIVTHDQGVVLVLQQVDDEWQATEIDRDPDIIVHEIELLDLDGDGTLEMYTTPSHPNRFDGTAQPGAIATYRYADGEWTKRIVEEFDIRHVKEVLAAEIGGKNMLLASVEGELAKETSGEPDAAMTRVTRYRWADGNYTGDIVARLPDKLCRFLNVGDVDGDDIPEVIASTHKQGLWVIEPTSDGEWDVDLIDDDSGGFEHATMLADLDGDGTPEIYVAADSQKEIRRYRYIDGAWESEVLTEIEDDKITFNVYAADL